MATFLEFVSNNSLISTLISAALVGAVGLTGKTLRDRRDSNLIYNFLVSSSDTTEFCFRSTHSIASHTNLSEERVAKLCAGHSRIRRNQKEKQSWRLAE